MLPSDVAVCPTAEREGAIGLVERFVNRAALAAHR